MKERIIEVIYSGWCEGLYGTHGKDLKEVQTAINTISGAVHADTKKELLIKATIMDVLNKYEYHAFLDAFALCLDLLNGHLVRSELES
ncbi:MAG: hypothetical protein SOY73_00080 [Blautia sp.]|nr:hypothetical protein [Blautia sp.]